MNSQLRCTRRVWSAICFNLTMMNYCFNRSLQRILPPFLPQGIRAVQSRGLFLSRYLTLEAFNAESLFPCQSLASSSVPEHECVSIISNPPSLRVAEALLFFLPFLLMRRVTNCPEHADRDLNSLRFAAQRLTNSFALSLV